MLGIGRAVKCQHTPYRIKFCLKVSLFGKEAGD